MKIKNFNLLKRFFAFVLALVMIFNLSSDIFAQIALNNNNNFYFPKTKQYQQDVNKLSLELEAQKRQQEILALQGITFESFQKELKSYAKKNNIDYSTIDEKASWENYLAIIDQYNKDYQTLVGILAKKTYQQVLSDGKYFLNKKDETIKYDGKNYNRTALIHATIHNFVTRQKNGYTSKGMFVFSKETAEPFTLEEKIGVMEYIYNAVENEGFYPQDSNNLYAFAYNIVENGKKYMDNDIYKADILPGLANAGDRQKRTNGQADRKKQADAIGAAIALLPLLSKTNTQKTQSAQVIYDLARKVMRDDYGVIGVSNGAQALIALKTEDSLNKLYTLLTEDLYRGLGTRVLMFALDSLSLEEWAKRDSGLVNRIKGGLGQYHNAIARRYLYIDPKKNDDEIRRLAQNSALEGFYNVVYTDMFEDIGKAIGKYSSDEKVAKIANRLASKYLQNTANQIRGGEKKLHTSLITGILATTKQKNETLTKAAKVIYNGSWWDINEATQRDKNNIAAIYLNLKKKTYNEQKKKDFKTICAGKTIGRFSDIAVNALFMGTLILSLPSIAKKVSTFSVFKIRNIKLKVKSVDVKVTKGTSEKPAQPKPVETKNVITPKQQNVNTPKDITAKTEKVEVKTEDTTPKQTEYTASVGEGGGGAAAGQAELSYTELSKMTRKQWLDEMAAKLKRAREAQEIEAETAANKGKISPYKRTWLVNKPWAELSPWRQTLATALINLEFNREIFLSSLRIFKPKYIGFSAPLPLTLTGEALLKPVASVTQMTRAAEGGFISTQAVFGAAQNAQRAAALAKASGSTAGVLNTNKALSMLDMFQQYSAGKGLLSGTFGINGILNEFHGGSSSGNSGLSTLEKENLIRANRTPQINSAVKTNNPYIDFMATQQNLNAQAKDIVKEAYKKHLKGDIKGAIAEYDKAIKLSPKAVFYFGRGLLKYYNLNDYENAITDFKKAIQLNPEDETYKILLEEAQEKLTEKQNKGKKTAKDKNVKRDKDVDWFIKYLETLVDDYASENIFDPVSAQSEQTSFKKILSDLRKKLFASGNKKTKLFISILPITMSVVMKAVEVSVDLVNKVPEIKRAYNKAEERTLKLMEKYNFSSQEAMEVFSDIFEKELTMANIPLERIQELLQEANNYMKGEHSVRLAQENSKEDTQAEFDEVNINTTADYDQTLAVLADDLRLYYDNQSNTWKYGYQQEPEDTFATINLIQEHYIQGKIYYEKGQYQQAIAELDQVITEHPYKTALEMRGQSKYNLGDYEGALADFTEVIAFGYNLPQDYFERGYTKERLGDYDGAIADYQKALKYNDVNSDMYQIYESIYNNAIEKAQTAKENPVEPQTPETETQAKGDNEEISSKATEEENSVSIKEEGLKEKINLPRMILDVFKESFYSRKALLSYYVFRNTKEGLKNLSLAMQFIPEEELSEYKEVFKVWSGGQTYEDYIKDNPLIDTDNTKTNSNVKDVLSDLKNRIFGPESSDGKLYMALPFVPKAVMQLLTNDITLEQLSNRQEVIETAFYKAQKRVPQEIVNTDEKEALNQFAYYFKMELEFAGVAQEKTDKLVSKVKKYIENNASYKETSEEDSQRLKQVMFGLRNKVFGPKSSGGKLFMAIIPVIPDEVRQLFTGNLTFEQLNNRTNAIQKAFDNAEEVTIKTLKNLDSPVAIGFFLTILYQELEKTGVSNDKINKVLEITKNYLRDQLPQDVRKEESYKTLRYGILTEQEGGDLEKVLKIYNVAIEWDNTNAEAYYRRAYIKFLMYDKTAKDDYEKAIALDPDNETYIEEYKLYLPNYKSLVHSNQSVRVLFKDLMGRLSNILEDLKNQAENKTDRPFSKDSNQEKAQEFAKRAYEKRLNGYKATSLAYYDEAIILDPSKAEYYYERALAKDQDLGDYDGAMADYISAMELDSQNADFYTENASKAISTKILRQEEAKKYADMFDFNIQEGNWEEALENMNKAIELDAYNSSYYYQRGNLKFNLEDLQGALADINKALELNPNIAKYYMARGAVKAMYNNFMGAFEDINKAIELDENNSSYYISRASIKIVLRSYNSALSDYNKAIKLNPENASYYVLRAGFKYHFGDYEGTLKDYNNAIRLDPENPEYYILRAPIRQGFGDIDGCLADYDKAIELDPEEDSFYNIRAIFKESLEMYDEAIEDFGMAISLNPENPEYYYTRALAISNRDGKEASLDDYDRAIALDPVNPAYYHGRGLAFQDKGEYDAAMEDFNNAIALDENEAEFYFTRALLNTEYEFYEDALPDMDKAININPYGAEYYYERGLLKEKLNDKSGSLEDFRSAYRLEPKNEKYKKALIKRIH